MDDIVRRIKGRAFELGFHLAGITTAEPSRFYPAYESWLDHDYHGTMTYLENERGRLGRQSPGQIQPDCRSVLCLGWRYPAFPSHDRQAGVDRGPQGRIAAYAWGRDYHDHLLEKMDELSAYVNQAVGRPVALRSYSDTGPILEREYAQRAGLGWAGKNTNLIAPRMGSYFLLAEILLDVALEPDEPYTEDRCGTCRRCLDACPTHCLLPGRVLDARRCIAYLTIEHKGALPLDLRPTIEDWIFGCDICQQVCPWNVRFSPPQVERVALDLIAEVRISSQEFQRRYGGTPVARARRRGYVRNVAVALGNAGDPAAIPALTQALEEDSEPLVRGHAAWALGRLGRKNGRAALTHAARREPQADVLLEIQRALEVN